MEDISPPVCKSSLESHLSSSLEENSRGATTTLGSPSGTALAECSVVPSVAASTNNFPTDSAPPTTTAELDDVLGVATIRTKLEKQKNLNAQAVRGSPDEIFCE
ncbi:hypothetical protein HMPREF1544_07092 [Mucor circinelloides 1006PhL]|uniref:Uncharacterized protein n=1 Tax=Mucor circinelloides f. circinelloides (strain 1006PhL) TaxID=1220926 RepID=S2J8Y3_MUCC1|nr:hypothetical protein HMPREF1544_07092 [Mucor circinelloides 1006PhL]